MRLFIANATHQVQSFLYRIPEQATMRNQHIPVGSQIALPEDLSLADIDYVLEQHTRYGLIPVDSIQNSKAFKGICYSVDKPVPAGKIEALMHHNRDELTKLGQKLRQEAALTSNSTLESELQENGRPEVLRNLEITVVEENHDERDTAAPVAEAFRVRREGEDQYGAPRTQRRKRR